MDKGPSPPSLLSPRVSVGGVLLALAAIIAIGPQRALQRLYFAFANDTEYAPGYDEHAFAALELGASEADVRGSLGPALSEFPVSPELVMLYATEPVEGFEESGEVRAPVSWTQFYFDVDERLERVRGQLARSTGLGSSQIEFDVGDGGRNSLGIDAREIERLRSTSATPEDIESRFGPPTARRRSDAVRVLRYSHSPTSTNYELRWIGLDRDGRVCWKRSEIHWD